MTHDIRQVSLFPAGQKFNLEGAIEYQSGAVVSKTLVNKSAGTLTLFAFDAGQGLSEHSAPYDAIVQILDGEGEITITGVNHRLGSGDAIIMPAGQPHAVKAPVPFKMLLIMIKA